MSDVKQPDPKAVEANIQARLKELTNVNRIVTNAIHLINDVEIKGAHAQPVTEIIGWLTGFSHSLTGQVKTLEATLPKAPAKIDPKVIKPELKDDEPTAEPGYVEPKPKASDAAQPR